MTALGVIGWKVIDMEFPDLLEFPVFSGLPVSLSSFQPPWDSRKRLIGGFRASKFHFSALFPFLYQRVALALMVS